VPHGLCKSNIGQSQANQGYWVVTRGLMCILFNHLWPLGHIYHLRCESMGQTHGYGGLLLVCSALKPHALRILTAAKKKDRLARRSFRIESKLTG